MFELATWGNELVEGIEVAKWMKPSEELPAVEVGDRICGIIMCEVGMLPGRKRPTPRLIILERTENGWESIEDYWRDCCIEPGDCVLWTTERDLCQVAAIVGS